MLPEDLLQQQAAIARTLSQKQKVKNFKQILNTNATVIGYNANLGQNIISLPDGSISYASSDTNGTLAIGETVPLHGSSMRVDGLPNIKRQPTTAQKKAITKPISYFFWLLLDHYLLLIQATKDKAIIKLLTDAYDYQSPYDGFSGSEPGIARIVNNSFYIPNYYSIDKYTINSKSASTILGVKNQRRPLLYTYSNCSTPSGHYFFEVETSDINYNQIYHYKPDGSSAYYPHFVEELKTNGGAAWSIVSPNETILFMVIDYGQLARFDILTNTFENIFHVNNSYYNGVPSRYGGFIEGYAISEVTYAFADVNEESVYIVCLIVDSGIPGLQFEYNLTGLQHKGIAPIKDVNDNNLTIISGNFPPGIVCPSDVIAFSTTVHKVIDENTVYGSFIDSIPATGKLDTSKRHLRTAIFKVNKNGGTSLYYKFPGIDKSNSADGYRHFYNLPSRGGIIDVKTKDIYMNGFRRNVIVDGLLQGTKDGFGDKTLIKIDGKTKALTKFNLSFDKSVPANMQNFIASDWNYFVQLEGIYT